MWIIAKSGFVSLVQHNTDPDLIRARARRREHLIDTFDLDDDEVIDLGDDAPDYRWHADISRTIVTHAMIDMIEELDYTSHVKEEVSGDDNQMHSAMMRCWSALMTLQRPLRPAEDWWTPSLFDDDHGYADAVLDHWDTTLGTEPGEPFQGEVTRLADRMLSGSADTNPDRPALKVYDYRGHHPDTCSICGDEINRGDEYVVTPRGFTDVGDEGGPTHAECIDEEIELDYTELDNESGV